MEKLLLPAAEVLSMDATDSSYVLKENVRVHSLIFYYTCSVCMIYSCPGWTILSTHAWPVVTAGFESCWLESRWIRAVMTGTIISRNYNFED